MDRVTVDAPGAPVQHKVGGHQHEEAELVSLALESLSGDVEGQPAQPGARDQHPDPGPVAPAVAVERTEPVQDWLVAEGSLRGAVAAPVPHELLDSGLDLVDVVGARAREGALLKLLLRTCSYVHKVTCS